MLTTQEMTQTQPDNTLGFSPNALEVMKSRYFAKKDGKVIEDVHGLFRRIAHAIAVVDRLYGESGESVEILTDKFYDLMVSKKFMPNSPTLMNAGRGLGMLSACFVLPFDDTLGDYDAKQRLAPGIMKTAVDTALIQRAGGGTGYTLDKLRPSGSFIKSSGGMTSGPISFWRLLSETTHAIQQGAFRRGANMMMTSVWHPDILKFVCAKEDLSQFTNYNISVKITDDWLSDLDAALTVRNTHAGQMYVVPVGLIDRVRSAIAAGIADPNKVRSIDNCYTVHDLTEVKNGVIPLGNWMTRRDLWNIITKNAWRTGEPGIVFIDRIRETEPTPHVGSIEASNPCVTGDTLILTLEGPRSFKELFEAGEDVLVHAWDPESKLPVIRMMRNIRVTAANTEILEVEFDSGLKVKCTPDHHFRTFRGKKVKARDLEIGQSVRAYAVTQHRDGHMRAHAWVANRCAHQWVHRMVIEALGIEIPDDCVVHHLDGDPTNNHIDNLQVISAYDHQSIHYAERAANGFSREGWKTSVEEVNAKISEKRKQWWSEQKAESAGNHKVVAIRACGSDTVYNGTVDDVHTYIIVDPDYRGEGEGVSGIVSCNCGEQFLLPDESCNLGSLNLAAFLPDLPRNGNFFTLRDYDMKGFEAAIENAVHFLENVVDANKFPTHETETMAQSNRKIGLGIMGVADLLFKLGIPYNSDEGRKMVAYFMEKVNSIAIASSSYLAHQRGVFKNYPGSRWEQKGIQMRNAEVTTIAPTGTISIVAGCSCGIEPLFSLAFNRNVLDGKRLTESHAFFQNLLMQRSLWNDSIKEEALKHGSIQHLDLPEDIKRVFVCAHDVEPSDHVKMQAECQKHVTNSISKTINLPEEATVETVSDIFLQAWKLRCKAITVYRNNCRAQQPMALAEEKKDSKKACAEKTCTNKCQKTFELADVPNPCPSVRLKQETAFGHLHIHISVDPTTGRELEIFAQLGHSGSVEQADLEGMCRMASLFLRSGGDLMSIINQWHDVGTAMRVSSSEITSLPRGVAKALVGYLKAKSTHGIDALLTGKATVPEHKEVSHNGNGNGHSVTVKAADAAGVALSAAVDKRLDMLLQQRDIAQGYAIKCPIGATDCQGFWQREGSCMSCSRCGASTCGS